MARAIKLPAPGGYRIFRGVFGIQDGGAGGGARGSRTPDLLNAIQALSQLSYGPVHPFVRYFPSGSDAGQPARRLRRPAAVSRRVRFRPFGTPRQQHLHAAPRLPSRLRFVAVPVAFDQTGDIVVLVFIIEEGVVIIAVFIIIQIIIA